MKISTSHLALFVIILILLIVDIILLTRSVSYQKEVAIKENIISDISVNTNLISYLESNSLWNIKCERAELENWSVIDSAGVTSKINELLEKPVLAYRFHENHCQECITFGMLKLESFVQNTNVSAVVLAHYQNQHLFRRWCSTVSADIDLFNLPASLPPDEMTSPYFFVIHKDKTIGELFIPDKSSPQYTSKYLEIITKKYYTD